MENKRNIRFSVFNKRPTPLEYGQKKEELKIQLPEDFAEKAIELESYIERNEFTSNDLADLMLLYSQAVEFYNSVNNPIKVAYYTERIQMVLMKPHVLTKMNLTMADPEKLLVAD